jgi:hypothetical protein
MIILGSAMNSEKEVSSIADGVLIFEDIELRVFEKHKSMGFDWVANDLTSLSPT